MRMSRSLTIAGFLAVGCCTSLAVSIARVKRAETEALRPVVVTSRPGMRPALVVFGAETTLTGPSPELSARLSQALRLWQSGVAQMIVVSGGVSGSLDEVADMFSFLTDAGVPTQVIMEGRPGGNTRQTISTIERIGAEHSMSPWIAVSTPFHARRIRDEARRAGIDVVVSGPKDSPETLDQAIHRARVITEAIATVFYLLPPSITTRVRTSTGTLRHSLPLYFAGVRMEVTSAPGHDD
jgi:uncharacterized SAM-binding protein YcdF (DUF218 family)